MTCATHSQNPSFANPGKMSSNYKKPEFLKNLILKTRVLQIREDVVLKPRVPESPNSQNPSFVLKPRVLECPISQNPSSETRADVILKPRVSHK